MKQDRVLLILSWTFTLLGTIALVGCSYNAERLDEPRTKRVPNTGYNRTAAKPTPEVAISEMKCHSNACLEQCADDYTGTRPKWCAGFGTPKRKSVFDAPDENGNKIH